MNLYRAAVSTLKSGFFKASQKRKVLSSGSVTLALGLGIFLFTGAGDKSPLDPSASTTIANAATEEQAAPIAPRTLSRQRKDFDKALGLLADAAASDKRLAEYHKRVQKRVKGEAFIPEQGSGVRVVKAASRGAAPVKVEQLSATESDSAEQAKTEQGGAWARLKSFVGSPMEETAQP